MNITLFILVFAGVIIIHELGHYLVALLFKIEVEEFGLGLPPRAFRYWRNAGFFILNDKRVEIPRNFHMTFDWLNVQNESALITVDHVEDKLILRTFEYNERIEENNKDGVDVNKRGEIVKSNPAPKIKFKKVNLGAERGTTEIEGVISEMHAGTDFTINWLPLGGFVRPKGENDPKIKGGLAHASPWARFWVLIAGPAMNVIAGIIIYSILFTNIGTPDFTKVQVNLVLPDSPAEQAGLKADDLILQANDQPADDLAKVRDLIYAHLDKNITFEIQRGDETLQITAMPSSKRAKDQGALGIQLGPLMNKPENFLVAIPYAAKETYYQAYQLISMPAQIIRGTITPEEGRFIGIKGIYNIFDQAITRDVESRAEPAPTPTSPAPVQSPSFYTLQLIATLNISIGLFNLFPFPALDGGRLFFLLPEFILRRRVPAQFENLVHGLGMTFLLLFMVYVNAMDFINPANIIIP